MIEALRARARELVGVGCGDQPVGHHQLQDVVEPQPPVGGACRLLRRRPAAPARRVHRVWPWPCGSLTALSRRALGTTGRCGRSRHRFEGNNRRDPRDHDAVPPHIEALAVDITTLAVDAIVNAANSACGRRRRRRRDPSRRRAGAAGRMPDLGRLSHRRSAAYARLPPAGALRHPHGRTGLARRQRRRAGAAGRRAIATASRSPAITASRRSRFRRSAAASTAIRWSERRAIAVRERCAAPRRRCVDRARGVRMLRCRRRSRRTCSRSDAHRCRPEPRVERSRVGIVDRRARRPLGVRHLEHLAQVRDVRRVVVHRLRRLVADLGHRLAVAAGHLDDDLQRLVAQVVGQVGADAERRLAAAAEVLEQPYAPAARSRLSENTIVLCAGRCASSGSARSASRPTRTGRRSRGARRRTACRRTGRSRAGRRPCRRRRTARCRGRRGIRAPRC